MLEALASSLGRAKNGSNLPAAGAAAGGMERQLVLPTQFLSTLLVQLRGRQGVMSSASAKGLEGPSKPKGMREWEDGSSLSVLCLIFCSVWFLILETPASHALSCQGKEARNAQRAWRGDSDS